jgi:hypothetical protein
MADLVNEGAILRFPQHPDVPEKTLAVVEWKENPTRILWCAIFPEHQGHVHENEYHRCETKWDRDVLFYNEADEMVMAVYPYREAARLDPEEVCQVFADWKQMLSLHNNKQKLADFIEDASKL